MNKAYFLLFIGCFVMVAGFGLGLGQNYLSAYGRYISSGLEASLINIKSQEISVLRVNEESKERRVSLLFVGDAMLSRGVGQQIEASGNPEYPFLKIEDYLKQNDLVFGNLEGPISDVGVNQGSAYSFRANLNVVAGLKKAGFNVVNLANNHILDWGTPALTETMSVLENNNINWIGAGRNETEANSPLVIKVGNTDEAVKIAFLGYTNLLPKSSEAKGNNPGISSWDIQKAQETIKSIKAENLADVIVVSFHWGDEYQKQANDFEKQAAHALIDAGADLVIGHHPHVVQEVEQYNGKFIAYSLGNFVFDQNFSEDTNNGLMIKVIIGNKNIVQVDPIGIKINSSFQPELTN